jgi:hypothetical protein
MTANLLSARSSMSFLAHWLVQRVEYIPNSGTSKTAFQMTIAQLAKQIGRTGILPAALG